MGHDMKSSEKHDWKPTATVETLKFRADVLGRMREFFRDRGVTEVETPLVSGSSLSHPETELMSTSLTGSVDVRPLYLQSSPESGMKRLIAAGMGPIYQLCKAFRNGEADRTHNPEFTILEWYRPGWNHLKISTEVDELLGVILGTIPGLHFDYLELFRQHLGINPVAEKVDRLRSLVLDRGLVGGAGVDRLERNELADILMKGLIEPSLGHDQPVFVFDFPETQACLARVDSSRHVAERFELFVNGAELGNGYSELTDAGEHKRRFTLDNETRLRLGRNPLADDERLLSVMEDGFPVCGGVALGIDRLVMCAAKKTKISEVIAFPIDRA